MSSPVAEFDGGALTSDAGGLLLGQHDAAINNCDRKGNLLSGLEFDCGPKILGAQCTECKRGESHARASD